MIACPHGRLLARGRSARDGEPGRPDEAGFAVEGLDVSPDMLAVCRQHCQDRGLDPVLREADMTTFAEPGAYQAIIIESLSPGGRLAAVRAAWPGVLAAFRPALPALC